MSFFLSSLTWGGHLKYLVKFSTIKEILFFINTTFGMGKGPSGDVKACGWRCPCLRSEQAHCFVFLNKTIYILPVPVPFSTQESWVWKRYQWIIREPDKILRETNHGLAFHPGDGVIPLFFYVAEIEVNYNNEVF